MAQTRKRKSTSSTSKRTAASSGSVRNKPAQNSATAESKPPRRREITAILCFLLGILSFIGYFDSEPLFISFFTGFAKRLIGHGFYALPPALIMCSVILAFHKGYPVLLRTISTLSLTAVIGALVHTFGYPMFSSSNPDRYELSFRMFAELWTGGAQLSAGGIISGGVSQFFLVFFGKYAAPIILIVITAILGLITFNATLAGVIGALSRREKRQYEVEEFEDAADMSSLSAEELVAADAYREQTRRKYRYPLIPTWKKKKIDIPLDEKRSKGKDYFSDDPMSELYNKTPGVKTPDELLNDTPPWDTAGGELLVEDLPLDIPFMDGRMKRPEPPPPVVPPIIEENFMSDVNLPPDVMQEVEKSRKLNMPKVPMPEGIQSDTNTRDNSSSGTDETDKTPEYTFPPIDLLSKGDPVSRAGDGEVSLNTERLEAAFQSFGINVSITSATRGPSVTRYEAELEAGIKLSRLTSLADDIALALGTIGVRIAAMPNKISTVGIEVPNKSVSKVHLRDVIQSSEFQRSPSKLTFAIGMDISGTPIIGEIPKLPHMLVAGTTGSGKSVCLNSIILSILYKATPKDVRFIMLDPKMVEFKVYNNIPHLLVPVVTDVKKAAGALQWATFEMMKRYSLFAETNARDIEGYNKIAQKSNEEREPLPQVVVVIDELADLMMMAAKEVEESVCRIAQMGRAAGIHLIIATQSPRANVITGLMKANIPSRIAFKVASALESQIILDPGQNADKLVGNGDMLYSPTGAAKPMRLQGTWVSDKEREKVVEFIKSSADAQYSEEVMFEIDKASADKSSGDKSGGEQGTESDHDELLPQAVDVIFETGQASVSMLQRRLKLGYARAARIVDQMEEMGIVGAYEGSKPRELLITRDQWRQMQYINGTAPVDEN